MLGDSMAKFLGFPYPVQKTVRGYFSSQSQDVDQIKSDLLILLLTNPGERVMNPRFGTPLKKLIFEPNDPRLISEARNVIINSIKQWEPRIALKQVEVLTKVDEGALNPLDDKSQIDHLLAIRIIFVDPNEIQSVQELTLEVPLPGGIND
jgi:phage baseplate assembly protein W